MIFTVRYPFFRYTWTVFKFNVCVCTKLIHTIPSNSCVNIEVFQFFRETFGRERETDKKLKVQNSLSTFHTDCISVYVMCEHTRARYACVFVFIFLLLNFFAAFSSLSNEKCCQVFSFSMKSNPKALTNEK